MSLVEQQLGETRVGRLGWSALAGPRPVEPVTHVLRGGRANVVTGE